MRGHIHIIHTCMISVENFYWALYENLLKPCNITLTYYYPFGTKQNLSLFEFDPFIRQNQANHALFHFDQEPLYTDDLGELYDVHSEGLAWVKGWIKILANSEHSIIKKQLCRSRQMSDWYFFYHGFASLDWFRDAEYCNRDHEMQNAFLCLNHITQGQRSYRISLLARLVERDILERGSISFYADVNEISETINKDSGAMSSLSRDLITTYITPALHLPRKLDDIPINSDLSARFGHHEYRLWQRSLLHVVNETVFYQPKLHLTEKVFKPIVAQRPFILVAAPGNLRYLRSYGFQTFGSWIDEGYDDIQDPDERLDAVADEVTRFATMSMPELNEIHRDMQSILTFNKQHFFGEFRNIIVNELVDNFDQCIRIWNNGRVDGRELPLHPDLNGVKRILLS